MNWTLLLSVLLTQAEVSDAGHLADRDGGTVPADTADAGRRWGLPFPVRFQGNLVLPDEIYQDILELPPGARPDLASAQRVADQVDQFLFRSGYELAEVSVSLEDGGLAVHVDEGKLEKVVFRGRFTVRMLRFKLALNLPQDVFNRPQLEREVAERARALGVDPPTWVLIEAQHPKHEGMQLEGMPSLVVAGRTLISPRARFELHFTFGEASWNTGVGVDLRSSWLNGLELGLNYQGTSVLRQDDRWRFGVTGGLGLRRDIPNRNIYVAPTRVRAELLWYTPPLEERLLTRGFLQAYGEWFFRQRRDLGLEDYMAVRTELSANAATRLHPLVAAQLGGGLQLLWLGPFTPAEGGPSPAFSLSLETGAPPWRLSAYGEAKLELTFFDGGARWDRRHALALQARLYGNLARAELPLFVEARFSYQWVIPFGWHDLWFSAKGTWMSGDVLFPFEEVMGQHLPGVFGDLWLRKAATAHVEYRYSLVRDLVKVGAFANGVVYGEELRETGQSTPRLGFSGGPSAHLLVASFFQVDLYLNFALLSNGRFGAGALLRLKKVF